MHHLKLSEAGLINATQMENAVLASPACNECLSTFRDNLRVILSLVAAPAFSALITMQYAEAGTKAAIKVYGKNYQHKLQKASTAQQQRHYALTQSLMTTIVEEGRSERSNQLFKNTEMLEQLVYGFGSYVHGIFEAILKSVCILSWGAIEVLLGDLLTKCVVENHLLFPDLDPAKFRFQKLKDKKGPRYWYDVASQSDSVITSIMNDASISALAEIRHVLVHKAGKVDKPFMDAVMGSEKDPATGMQKVLPNQKLNRFSAMQKGDSILFDGELVRFFVDPAITAGYSLISAMDSWITSRKHPTSKP